jgi:hypothetical protein
MMNIFNIPFRYKIPYFRWIIKLAQRAARSIFKIE